MRVRAVSIGACSLADGRRCCCISVFVHVRLCVSLGQWSLLSHVCRSHPHASRFGLRSVDVCSVDAMGETCSRKRSRIREKEGRIRVKLYVISRLACRYSTPVYPSHPIPFHDPIALTLLLSTCILPAGPFHQHAYRASRPRPPTVSFPSSQRFDPSTRYQHLIPARPAHRTLPEAPLPFVFAFCRHIHVYAATLTLVSAHLTQQSLMCIAERMSMPNRAR